MTKRRATVTGWDPTYANPNGTTGRPKGVQTAIDARIAMTYDVLAEGIFAKYGVPAITGSPTNSASISKFQAAIASPNGGFYIVTVDAAEPFTINMANVGAVKIYVQQEDYEVDNTKVNSAVNIGVVYGATAIPANSLLLFTTTISSQTSTNGLTFTPAFKYTGSASGMIQVPTQADLSNIVASLIQAGRRALVTTTGGGGTVGEYFYTGSAWQQSSVANAKLDNFLTANVNTDGSIKPTIGPANLDPTKWPAFLAYGSGGQGGLTSGVFTKVTAITSERYDVTNAFNTTNQRFVAAVKGVYRFLVNVGISNDDTRMFGSIYRNGVEIARGTNGSYTGNSNINQTMAEFDCAAGDYVEMYAWRNSSGSIQAASLPQTGGSFGSLSFSGSLVTPLA